MLSCAVKRVDGLNPAQVELYNLLKIKHDNKDVPTNEDFAHVYSKRFRVQDDKTPTDASVKKWVKENIATLIMQGYLGLTFKRDIIKCNPKENMLTDYEPEEIIDTIVLKNRKVGGNKNFSASKRTIVLPITKVPPLFMAYI